nr:hypothetical protein [uncultured Mucilaginibacter sp.]
MKAKVYLALMVVLFIGACGKGGSPGPGPKPAETIEINLTSPAQNELCTTGQIISDSQSKITFNWQAVSGASSYIVVIEDLLSHDATFDTVSTTSSSRILKRNNPYSWRVVSKIASNIAQSKAWRFYNAGVVTTGYAPYPAVAYSPFQGENVYNTSTLYLQWQGNAVDNNIKNYDVYFGTTTSPPLYLKETNATSTNSITVDKTTYYWKVITRDTNGNTSESQLYQFTVK